ncbi:MAG TPA: YkvA family protein [Polyangiaceae bacterium]|nr:YkvA family protein [Polyangiaceae bacterium]
MSDTQRHEDFYQALRARIASWLESKGAGFKHAQILLLAPDLFHLLTRLLLDRRIPAAEKATLGAAVAYFLSPVDLLPEALLGPAGYVDDIALAAYALSRLINAGHGAVAKELWAGDGDLLDVIQRVLEVADEMLGSGLWERLKTYFRSLS